MAFKKGFLDEKENLKKNNDYSRKEELGEMKWTGKGNLEINKKYKISGWYIGGWGWGARITVSFANGWGEWRKRRYIYLYIIERFLFTQVTF